MKTRFEREISGELGAFWQEYAEKEIAKIREDLANGQITIDQNGVGYNCIGRVLMEDMAEKVAYVDSRLNREANRKAREIEVAKSLAEYRANYKGPSAEELAEMRSAFGTGTKVVNVLTGTEVWL